MDRYIARANIDHYLGLLDDADLTPEKRAVITKLLIEEEDRLGHDLEQLEFAETRAANGRKRLNRLRQRLDNIAEQDRATTEQLVAAVEATQKLLEGFCERLRSKVNSR